MYFTSSHSKPVNPHPKPVNLQFQTSEHRQLVVSEGVEGGGAEGHPPEHLCEDHSVHRPRKTRLFDEGNRFRSPLGRKTNQSKTFSFVSFRERDLCETNLYFQFFSKFQIKEIFKIILQCLI